LTDRHGARSCRAMLPGLVLAACLAALAGAGACGGSPQQAAMASAPPPAPPKPPPAPEDQDGRLPATAVPVRYKVSLRIDPARTRFQGVAAIDVTVPAPTWNVVLDGRDLNVVRASARVGGRELPATVTSRSSPDSIHADELVFAFGEPLPAGSAELHVEYDAPFAADLAGLYRVEQDGRSYVVSQFESADARRAMPCFDEPSYKTPYEVTVTAPRGMLALSNSPEVGASDAPGGWVVHRFAPTPPLPSYLLAFAVGEFDVTEGRRAPVPIRVVTTRGHGGTRVEAAIEAADGLLTTLSTYFGMPYPFDKLDLVAVPDLAAGAMENPGLLTFRESLLVQDPAHVSTDMRRLQAVVIAHELAHQWFGDLVTMRWWDDLWLNEGFATWAEAMAVDAWKPSFGAVRDALSGLGHVMDADGLASARAVREPVHSVVEADEAFDGLTYDKGAAVLRMIERWVGPPIFRRGVQRYIRDNAWKTARAEDLFHAIDYVTGVHSEPFAAPFLDHAGVPEVFAHEVCAGGQATLELRQDRWLPLGEQRPAANDDPGWSLPICVAIEGHKEPACFTLGSAPIARKLGPGCPAWIHPNADGVGYYRFVVGGAELLALARAGRALDPLQRVAVVSNGWAAVRAGALDPSALLDTLRAFDGDTDRRVVGEIVSVLGSIDDSLVDDPVRDRYRRFVAARLGARKRALGWEASAGESDDDDRAVLRHILVSAMGEVAHDDATLVEAEGYAEKWLKDPASVPSDVAAIAVPMASLRAGKDRLEALRAAAKNATSAQDRTLALRAMGSFEDPAVLFDAFDAAIGGEVKLSELRYVFGAALDHRAGRPALYAWEKSRWPTLGDKLPGSFERGQLVSVAGALCSASERADTQAFFTDAIRPLEGLKRSLAEALESSALCVALHDRGAADLSRYLIKASP
jgi:cytosol alanyl aminopeptidase